MGESINLKIYNTDRNILSTVLHKPVSKKKSYPAVILLHGFTGYKDEVHIKALADAFADNDIIAVRFDCAGFGESEGDLEYDYRVTNYINDLDCVYNSIKHLDYVQADNIGLWGHSMGGLIAIEYAKSNPDIKLVSVVSSPTAVGVSPWLSSKMGEWKQSGYLELESSKYGKIRIPYAFMEDARQYSALDSVKELKQPILVVVGTADSTVSPQDTKQLFEHAHEPKKLYTIEEMGHDYKKYPNLIEEVNNAEVAFFRTNFQN